jgi:hypothetical protein
VDFEDDLRLIDDCLAGRCTPEDLPEAVREALLDAVALLASDRGMIAEQPMEKAAETDAIQPDLVQKADTEHRFTLGPWYIPDRYDAHGEWTDADELQKALWSYVKTGDRGIRLQHNKDIVAGEWLEAMSFPAPVTMSVKKDATSQQVTYPAGTVFLGVQWKPWAWELVKKGKIRGFSIGGAAGRIEMGMPQEMGKAKSFGGDRSAAARYAAEQRWARQPKADRSYDTLTNFMRGVLKFTTIGLLARAGRAKDERARRIKAGKPNLIDKIHMRLNKMFPSSDSSQKWSGTDWYDSEEGSTKTFRPNYGRRTGTDRGPTWEMVRLPNGKTVTMAGGYSSGKLTVSKSRAEIALEMRQLAKAKSFGGDRSAAGRYAANIRWMREKSGQKAGPFPKVPKTKLGKALKSEWESRNACSLTTHVDYDGLAAEMQKRGMTTASPDSPELVYRYLSAERRAMWDAELQKLIAPVADGSADGLQIFIKGGGGASGKSTSGKIPELTYAVPTTYEDAKDGQPTAVLINVDDFKTSTEEFKNINSASRRRGEDECKKAGVSPDSPEGKEIMRKNFARGGAATFVHEESSLFGKLATTLALKAGKDIMIDGTMDNGVNQRLAELAYWKSLPNVDKVRMIIFSCDVPEAVRRASAREVDSKSASYGRVVPPDVLADAHMKVSKNFPIYAQSDLFDSILVMDTNSRPATAIARVEQGNLEVLDQTKFDGFLRKADVDPSQYRSPLTKGKQPLKDPKGGLTAAGRRHFKETEGANLKPGVKGPADTPEKMRRKGSFLTRFYTNLSGPLQNEKGEPTRLALAAAAWGEPVPKNEADAKRLAAKGRTLLQRYESQKKGK